MSRSLNKVMLIGNVGAEPAITATMGATLTTATFTYRLHVKGRIPCRERRGLPEIVGVRLDGSRRMSGHVAMIFEPSSRVVCSWCRSMRDATP